MQYLLQIAGVNIYSTVEDTRQLSVKRGSSLLLRQAIKDISTRYTELKSISTGASTGLFQFGAVDDNDAAQYQEKIVRMLNTDASYKFLTFVVDIVEVKNSDNGFQIAKEKVIALNRFRQFQQATLIFPLENTDSKIPPCAWDNLRPADGGYKEWVAREKGDRGLAKISLSTETRHNFGREQKQKFVKQETETNSNESDGLDKGYAYTSDLQEIAAIDATQDHLKTLKDKLAIIYFDGNGFGGIQNGCKDSDSLEKFDKKVQQKRKAWLRNLLEKIKNDEDYDFRAIVERKNESKHTILMEVIRLEILLWGGDEIMIAVPAWRGMQVLQHFYNFHKDWTHDGKQLTHAGGLVFCHVKTPIQRTQKLAREIADHIKDKSLGNEANKIDKYSLAANLYDYTVLESIDYPTQSWETFLAKRYTHKIADDWEPQKPLYTTYDNYADKFKELTDTIPRRQLYRLASAIIKDGEKEKKEKEMKDNEFNAAYKQFKNVIEGAEHVDTSVQKIFPNTKPNLHWLHFIELWDYFAPQTKIPNKEKSSYEEKLS